MIYSRIYTEDNIGEDVPEGTWTYRYLEQELDGEKVVVLVEAHSNNSWAYANSDLINSRLFKQTMDEDPLFYGRLATHKDYFYKYIMRLFKHRDTPNE